VRYKGRAVKRSCKKTSRARTEGAKATAVKRATFEAKGPLPMPRDLLTAGIELDPETERDREARMEQLKAELRRRAQSGDVDSIIDMTLSMVIGLERENERMAWRLLKAIRYRFGQSTEKLSKDELRQLFLSLGGDEAAASTGADLSVPAPEPLVEEVSAEPATSSAATSPKKKRKKKPGGRMAVAPWVERNVTHVSVPAEERACALCGKDKCLLRHAEHERIRYVPAKIVVDVEVREILACNDCRKDVSVAPRLDPSASVRRVDASVLAKLVADKCTMSLPLHRQRKELARMGFELPDKTADSYFAYTLDTLEPVAVAHLARLFASPIVGADDTHLKVLDRNAKNGRFRGHLWCFVGTDGLVGGPERVGYAFAPTWEAEELVEWFSAIKGLVQCDGYAGYASELELDDGAFFVPVPDERRLGCAMHVRSKFHAALLGNDRRAAIPLKFIADLYQIEADCKQQGIDAEARTRARSERSIPIFDSLYEWIEAIDPKLLPKSPLREATGYALGQKGFLRRCFEDGRLDIDNGRVERRIRPFCVGRRNFLFTGSVRGGERLAIAYTLVDSCLLLGIDPYRYLRDVLVKIESGWPLARLSELIPERWALEHAAQQCEESAPAC
jgi:transposase